MSLTKTNQQLTAAINIIASLLTELVKSGNLPSPAITARIDTFLDDIQQLSDNSDIHTVTEIMTEPNRYRRINVIDARKYRSCPWFEEHAVYAVIKGTAYYFIPEYLIEI